VDSAIEVDSRFRDYEIGTGMGDDGVSSRLWVVVDADVGSEVVADDDVYERHGGIYHCQIDLLMLM
jgi:hypothetical protein